MLKDRMRQSFALSAILIAMPLLCGCTTDPFLRERQWRENALEQTLNLIGKGGPQVSPRTEAVLKRYGLSDSYQRNPVQTYHQLRDMAVAENGIPDPDPLFAAAEISYIAGKKADDAGDELTAMNHYESTITATYTYLLSPQFDRRRNVYDPQFRAVCDLYNEALEDLLRLLYYEGQRDPTASAVNDHLDRQLGKVATFRIGDQKYQIETRLNGDWKAEDFERFEFVSDYRVAGLNNRHQTFGLGVPLIAIHSKPDSNTGPERFHPESLSFPVTALLRCDGLTDEGRPRCILEFFDPLESPAAMIGGKAIPLETDITTPLAYFLDSPEFNGRKFAFSGLLNPMAIEEKQGFYLLEPYDRDRIPVIMVHGLASSPVTWMDMFNDLRNFPEIRERYQFWFYLYPTGQPFWISATQMRRDLADMRDTLDPKRQTEELDQIVLVGHSMGGLVSRMQAIESGDDFWQLVSNQPITELEADDEDRFKLASTLFFRPNPSVRRVITIGTPHRGSEYANDITKLLGQKLIRLPRMLMSTGRRLVSDNPGFFKDTKLLTTTTSIDSLEPESPIFPILLRAKTSHRVAFHNIVGVQSRSTLLSRFSERGDGVVSFASARLDEEQRKSELIVDADHTKIHSKPQTILEVRRILLEHLQEVDREQLIAGMQSQDEGVRQVSRSEPLPGSGANRLPGEDKAGQSGPSRDAGQVISIPFSDN